MSSSRSPNIHIVRKFNNSTSTAASSTPQSPTLLGIQRDHHKKEHPRERQRQDLFQFATFENNSTTTNNNNNNNNSNSNSRESSGAIRPGKIRSGFIAFGESDDAISSGGGSRSINRKSQQSKEEYIVGETNNNEFSPSSTTKISTTVENAFTKSVHNNNVSPSSPSNRVTPTATEESAISAAPVNINPMNFVGVLDRNEVRGYSHRNQRSHTMVSGLRGSALLSLSQQQQQQRNNSLQPMTTNSATDILDNINFNNNNNNRRSTVAGGKFTKQQQPPFAFANSSSSGGNKGNTADPNPLLQHQHQHQQQHQRDPEMEMLKARVSGVARREGAKAEGRRQREQAQLQRDAREIEDWRGWHRDVRDREAAEAEQRTLREQQQRRASRRSIAMNLLKGRGLIDTSNAPNHASNRSFMDEDSFMIGGRGGGSDGVVDGTDLLSDDDYATLFGNDDDDEDDDDGEENEDESFIQQQNQHFSQNNNINKPGYRHHRPSTTSDLIKKLRMERTKRKRQELQRLRQMNMTSSSASHGGGGGRYYGDDDENTKYNNNSGAVTSPTNFFQDLDAEEEFIMVQARLDYKVAVTNMIVCEHEERQQRNGVIEDEAFIWSTSLVGGYFARGCREAVLMEQSRRLLAEAKEQRRIWFYIDYMVEDFENGIKRDFVAGREQIRQHDLFVLFESLDEATQRHLVAMRVADRERFLDDLAVERFLKNKVNGLKRQKHSLIV